MLQLPVSGQRKIRRWPKSELFFWLTFSLKYGCSSASGRVENCFSKKGNVVSEEHSVATLVLSDVPVSRTGQARTPSKGRFISSGNIVTLSMSTIELSGVVVEVVVVVVVGFVEAVVVVEVDVEEGAIVVVVVVVDEDITGATVVVRIPDPLATRSMKKMTPDNGL